MIVLNFKSIGHNYSMMLRVDVLIHELVLMHKPMQKVLDGVQNNPNNKEFPYKNNKRTFFSFAIVSFMHEKTPVFQSGKNLVFRKFNWHLDEIRCTLMIFDISMIFNTSMKFDAPR